MSYNARWYDPSLGRFAQPDTLIPEQMQGVQAWDRYAYVNNNPVRYTDPTGHCIFCNWNFSISYNLSAAVNARLNSIGINGADAAKVLDNTAKVLDGIGLAIDTAVAVGDVASAVGGALTGGFLSISEAGAPSVVTVHAGAAVGMGLFEANLVTGLALGAGNVAATFSFLATQFSDVITGETNSFGSLAISSDSGVEFNNTMTVGRDTLTSETLMVSGWLSPIGLTSVPLAAAAFANDFDLLYIGPFSTAPKSFPVINLNVKLNWGGEKRYYEHELQWDDREHVD
ncbi:MAG: RHS repeat-associated core domain-containing protein [Chloroflexota bacterium]|nr:RHS repeat-associated core domain-containing protein [Chloroflexota bacterium]MBI5703756.1 RHS repeat-associated core domain-containing protein [Chloroflexota bacterium]